MKSSNQLTVLFLFISTLCSAQDFGALNSTWVYDHNGGLVGITLIEYDRDTIIMEDTIKLFSRTIVRETSSGVMTATLSQPMFIRDKNQVVEFTYNPAHFDTLYNFNAEIGSSWTINERRFDGTFTGYSMTRTVLDTFQYSLNGISTFCQAIQSSNEVIPDTICQGIGSRVFYIDPFDHLEIASDGGEGGVLRCYSDENFGTIKFRHPWEYYGGEFTDFEYDCDQLTSLTTSPSPNTDFDIYPNPAVDVLYIQSTNLTLEKVAIFNLHGQKIYEEAVQGEETIISISALLSGMYYVLINGQYYEKLVVGR